MDLVSWPPMVKISMFFSWSSTSFSVMVNIFVLGCLRPMVFLIPCLWNLCNISWSCRWVLQAHRCHCAVCTPRRPISVTALISRWHIHLLAFICQPATTLATTGRIIILSRPVEVHSSWASMDGSPSLWKASTRITCSSSALIHSRLRTSPAQ